MIAKFRLVLIGFVVGVSLWMGCQVYSTVSNFKGSPKGDIINGEELAAIIKTDSHKLSKGQMRSFFKNGYLIIPGFFNEEEVSLAIEKAMELQQDAEELVMTQIGKVMHRGAQFVIDRVNGRVQIHRIVWAGAAQPELLRLSRQQKLLVPVAQLLDSNKADHLINQLHYKLPNDGVSFKWHQDVQNRRLFDKNWQNVNGKGSFIQAIIALDEMTPANGPLLIVPGSHTKGDLLLDLITDSKELESKVGISRAVPIEMRPGDLLLLHPALVHSSKANESGRPRRVLINGFSYPGANHKPYPGDGSSQEIDLLSVSD